MGRGRSDGWLVIGGERKGPDEGEHSRMPCFSCRQLCEMVGIRVPAATGRRDTRASSARSW